MHFTVGCDCECSRCPSPFIGTPSVCAATQHSVLLMFLRDFSASCPTQKQLVACNRRRIWLRLCGPVSKSAPENKFMIYRKHMLRSLSIHPSLSPSLFLSPTTGNASLLQSPACCCYCYCCMCFLSASFVQFPFLGISLYSFPIIIAAITNNHSSSIGTWNGVWCE